MGWDDVRGMFARARSLWRALRRGSRLGAEMEEEFRIHIEMRTEELIRSGLAPGDAARRARLEFGSTEVHRERGREALGLRLFDEIEGDLRYGLRTLGRTPGFTVVAVVTLALGIGATTAIFSALDAVMLRPLPFAEPHRLVELYRVSIPYRPAGGAPRPKSLPDIEDARELDVFTGVAAYAPGGLNLSGGGAPRRIRVGVVTPDFFAVLGVGPAVGRAFVPEEGLAEGPRVAIVSHALWRGQLGADTGLEDRRITLNGREHRVVGVMPAGFSFPEEAEVWLPMSVPTTTATWEAFRQYMPSRMIARLAPGVGLDAAEVGMERLFAPYAREDAPANASPDVRVRPLRAALVGGRRGVLLVLLGATGLVLLVACANVANLLLSRAAVRQREIAVRSTLGATTGRITRQLLVESLLLALGGGVLGVVLAVMGVQLLDVLVPPGLSGAAPLRADGRVLGFTLFLAVGTGLAFGLVPGLAARRTDAAEVLKTGNTGSAGGGPPARLRKALLVGEVALTVMLLVGSGLMLRSLHTLLATDPGVRPEQVATLELTLAPAEYESTDERRAFYEGVLERLEAMPEVEAAGAINELPMRGEGGVRFLVHPEGRRPERVDLSHMAQDLRVTPSYFRAMGIRILSGRAPEPRADSAGLREVAISEELARLQWPDADPVGDRLDAGGTSFEIVGVVADVRPTTLESEVIPQAYYSLLDTPYDNAAFVARGPGPAGDLARLLERAVREVAPRQAVYNVRTMEQVISRAIAPRRVNTGLITAFAVLSLVLAAVGVYGVIAFGVASRTREIGIRMALGATAAGVRRLVLTEALGLAFAGAVLGVAGAWGASRVLDALVYGVSTTDPLAFLAAPVVVLAAATVAALVPARRATRVEPTRAIGSS